MRQYTVGWHVCVNESSLELFGLMVVPSRSETIDAFPCYNVHPPDAVTEVAYAETQHVCVRPRGVVNKNPFPPNVQTICLLLLIFSWAVSIAQPFARTGLTYITHAAQVQCG